MATPVTTADITQILNDYKVAAKATAEHGPVMRNLMWNLPLPKRQGTSVDVPE